MHPMKKASAEGHNAKLRRLTRDYGSASGPANNKLAPTNIDKGEGPEEAIGFGAEGGAPRDRADRSRRKPAVTNPIPTYRKGGAVKKRAGGGDVETAAKPGNYPKGMQAHQDAVVASTKRADAEPAGRKRGGAVKRADGGDVSPIAMANRTQAEMSSNADKASNRARGGRAKKGGKTNVNVIVAPQGGAAPPPPAIVPPPALAAAGPPKPPMGPPPMGAKPMLPPGAAGLPMAPGAPGGMPPGVMPPRKRGGRVHADEAEDKALIQKTLKDEGLVRARGGKVHHMTAGAATGEGRLEKIGKKPHDAGRPQAV